MTSLLHISLHPSFHLHHGCNLCTPLFCHLHYVCISLYPLSCSWHHECLTWSIHPFLSFMPWLHMSSHHFWSFPPLFQLNSSNTLLPCRYMPITELLPLQVDIHPWITTTACTYPSSLSVFLLWVILSSSRGSLYNCHHVYASCTFRRAFGRHVTWRRQACVSIKI